MTTFISPTDQEWRELYDAATMFQTVAPWEWMGDDEIFGVQNPETEEIGYCCVMGALGQLYGLAIYRGQDGLDCWRRLRDGKIGADDSEMCGMQNCLMATFEDNQSQEKRDRQVTKRLYLKFHGKTAWPLFRSHVPNCFPWYLDSAEARFLSIALRQAAETCRRIIDDEDDLVLPDEENVFLVRHRDGEQWKDKRVTPTAYKRAFPKLMLDELLFARVKALAQNRTKPWEIHLSTFPSAVQEEEERPYFGKILIVCDRDSYFTICIDAIHPNRVDRELLSSLLRVFEKVGALPAQVYVKSPELREALLPALNELNVPILLQQTLPAVDSSLKFMLKHMGA